jgi:NAD(P)-dependent dehydrogenase (short-subunit alcohol dehydrogenase family)
MNRLAGKVTIVTGAALGIGRACAQRLAEEGAKVALFDVLKNEGQALAAALTAQGLDAAFWPVDVTRELEVQAAIDGVARRFGAVHVVVNNAGVAGTAKKTEHVSETEWDWVQAVNVKGVFFMTKHALPHLRAAGSGSIVNLSSIAGLVGLGALAPYHASKGAVRLMSRNDAIAYAPEGIRVNAIHPGYIWTPMVQHHLEASGTDLATARAATDAAHPLGHMGDVDDIAWAVVWLASDEAKFVTGAEIAIDGGYTAR